MTFDAESIRAERIIEDDAYAGVRVRFEGRLGKALLHMQVDIGFSDKLVKEPELVDYPTLLDMPGPRLRVYPLESFVAEKFEAMVALGLANSRLKDFYDLCVVSEVFEVDGERMARAMAITFGTRHTPLPESVPQGLSAEFVEEKSNLWQRFVQRLGDVEVPIDLGIVVGRLKDFLLPPAAAARSGSGFGCHWEDGQWKRAGRE